ncbi:hypothetical protein K2V69_13415 [Staphylococcus gallinarum]|uniref:hypothetical protein n=1 Tax=Staphylococcus gallinarum TaxID=1293 RepID=UPI001E3254F9|nr:hypothetical protein [Staphylococcus gallinarum]MCD8921672.1 hypothetical protein [Staphylococcus gallinarum]
MKIKTKKQLNLPQLIEWAMKNDMHERSFCGDRYGDAVHFDENEDILCDHVSLTETFTVEVEEEITEDTVLPKMLEMYRDATSNLGAEIYINQSINSVIENAEVLTLHIVNDDGTHTLIWRDGKLV